MENFDESDQASMVGDLFSLHLNNHPNKEPDRECPFCKAFIIDDRPLAQRQSLQSYSFLIMDISDGK